MNLYFDLYSNKPAKQALKRVFMVIVCLGAASILPGCASINSQLEIDHAPIDTDLAGSVPSSKNTQTTQPQTTQPQTTQPQTTQQSVPNPYLDTHLRINREAKAWFADGKSALSQSDYKTAEHWFQEVNRKYPQYSGALVNLGIIHAQRQEWEQAEAMFRKAINTNPNNLYAYNQLGYIYRAQGKFSDAEKSYLKAVKIWPDFANAWLNLGILYDLYMNRLPEAIAAYKQFQAITQDPDHEVKNWVMDLERRQQNAAK